MFYEMLVASPQHVRWVRTPSRFSLEMLGARPVDFNDSSCRFERTWRNDHNPWFGRDKHGYLFTFMLVELHSELDAGYCTIIYRPSDIQLVDA